MELTALMLMFQSLTSEYQLPEGLLASVCYIESNFNPRALHVDDGGTDSIGLCQIKLATARLLGFKGPAGSLQRADVNARFASKYLRAQLDRYGGDVRKAVSAYNAGSWRLNRHGEAINKRYIEKVFSEWANQQRNFHPAPKAVSVPKADSLWDRDLQASVQERFRLLRGDRLGKENYYDKGRTKSKADPIHFYPRIAACYRRRATFEDKAQ